MNSRTGNRSSFKCSLWAVWLCVTGWVLPGCGASTSAPAESAPSETSGSAAKEGSQAAAGERAKSGDDAKSPAAKPATLAEVRQAIDWLTFPKLDGAMWERTSLQNTHYWVPGTIAQAADFYRKTMTAQGWTESKKVHPDTEPEKYQSMEFSKAGFLVGVGLSGKKEYVEVNLYHNGNVDARRLPTPAGANVKPSHSNYVTYTTASKPEAAAEYCRKEFSALGWRDVYVLGAKNYAKEGKTIVRLMQNAMQCEATISTNKDGETEVTYHTFLAREYAPADVAASLANKEIPKPATIKEAIQILDLQKLPRMGESTPKINTGLQTEYEARASVAKAVAFYRKALTEQGWTLVLPLEDEDARGVLHFEKAGYHLSLKFMNLIQQPKKTGLVKIEIINHGNVDLRQYPYLPGAEIGSTRDIQPQYRTSASADEAAAFYRKELAKLGWKETSKGEDGKRIGYHLRFSQNDARLRVTIDTPRDGQTPIQVSTDFGGER